MKTMHRGTCSRRQFVALSGMLMTAGLAACGQAPGETVEAEPEAATDPFEVRVGLLNCPASLGLIPLTNKARAGETAYPYTFVYQRNYAEVEQALTNGELDVALLQPTRAAALYNDTAGGLMVLDVAGLGEWTLISRNRSVKRFGNLRGRTIYTSGRSGALGFTLRYLLELAGLKAETNVVYLASTSQVAAALSEDPAGVGIAAGAQTAEALLNDPRIVRICELSDVWEELMLDGSACTGYLAVARKEFLDAHRDAAKDFVAEHKASAEAFLVDPATYAPDAVSFGIVPSEEVCLSVATIAQVEFYAGAEMRLKLERQLQVYANRHIPLIGGALPGDDFYLMSAADQAQFARLVEEQQRLAEERALEEAAAQAAEAGQ